MKLIEYLKLYKDSVDFDIPDNEIDYTVTICYEKDQDYTKGFYEMFIGLLLEMVDIDYLISDGTPVCKFTQLILNKRIGRKITTKP